MTLIDGIILSSANLVFPHMEIIAHSVNLHMVRLPKRDKNRGKLHYKTAIIFQVGIHYEICCAINQLSTLKPFLSDHRLKKNKNYSLKSRLSPASYSLMLL